MGRYNKNLGDFGEAVARDYLVNNGMVILESNYSAKSGEIDIIAKDDEVLVFVEVKTRSSMQFGYPSEAVNKNKIEHMIKTAEKYIEDTAFDGDVRFDIVEVTAKASDVGYEVEKVNHIINIIID